MTFIDIHAHLEFFKKPEEIKKIVENAKKKNVKKILACGMNPETNKFALKLSEKFPGVNACLGIYPSETTKLSDVEFEKELNFIKKNKNRLVAIGEIGLDAKNFPKENFGTTKSQASPMLRHPKDFVGLKEQEERFRELLKLAKEIDKPVVIHSRKAEERAIEVLEEMNMKKVLMHCFSGKKKLVQRIINNKWYLSIPTKVKFSKQFQEIIKITPIEQLFCETDTPFLHPDKTFPNTPKNVIESYKKIAEIKGLEMREVENKVGGNYKRLFEVRVI